MTSKKKIHRSDYLNMLHGEGNWTVSDARTFNNVLTRIRRKATELGIDREPSAAITTLPCHVVSHKVSRRGAAEPITFRSVIGFYRQQEHLHEKGKNEMTVYANDMNNYASTTWDVWTGESRPAAPYTGELVRRKITDLSQADQDRIQGYFDDIEWNGVKKKGGWK